MQWIKDFKIALIEENEKNLEKLLEIIPEFTSLDQMQEVAHLMAEVHQVFSSKKDKMASNMLKIKKQKEYLLSTHTPTSKFNIK